MDQFSVDWLCGWPFLWRLPPEGGRKAVGVVRANNNSYKLKAVHNLYLFVDFTKIGCVFYYYAKCI